MSESKCQYCGAKESNVKIESRVVWYQCGTGISLITYNELRDTRCYEREITKLKKLLNRCAAAMIENDGDAQQQLISEIGGLNGKK